MCQRDERNAPGNRRPTHTHRLRAQRQPRLLVQQATDQGSPPQRVQAPRHGPRGAVEAPEQTDSQRVDLTRQGLRWLYTNS